MANSKERQVKEAFEAIHLPEDIAARALESIEAKREQRESERAEGLLTAQENAHANKHTGQEGKVIEEPFASQASCHASETSKGQGSSTPQNELPPISWTRK